MLDGPFKALFWGFAAAAATNAWKAAYAIGALACLMRETGVLFIAAAVACR